MRYPLTDALLLTLGSAFVVVKNVVTESVSIQTEVVTALVSRILLVLPDWAAAVNDAIIKLVMRAVFTKVILFAFMLTVLNTVQSNAGFKSGCSQFRRMDCCCRPTGKKHHRKVYWPVRSLEK